MNLRIRSAPLAIAALLCACGSREDASAKLHRAADNAAHAAGKAAYVVSHETKKAAEATGKGIEEAGHQAAKGWQDAKKTSR